MSAIQFQTSYFNHKNYYTVILEPAYPPGWQMPLHRHLQCELALIKSGCCTLHLGKQEHRLQVGNVFFIPSGIAHGFLSQKPAGVEFVVLQFPNFDGDFLRHLVNAPPIGIFQTTDLGISVFLEHCYKLQKELASNLPFSETQCRILVEGLTIFLLRNTPSSSHKNLSPQQKNLIKEILSFLQSQSHNLNHVKEVSKKFGISPQYLRKLFKIYTGVNPKHYLNTLKIQRSKCLLLHPELSITDVAMELGFGSSQQFAKIFRKNIGICPSAWRKINLLDADHERQPG
ncbi:helix-turn-helix domain-containing protein [Atrimonas thermophila]|uniref:helix-turn-helix transcriptional regulator n=1 Tax=Atrimonas thermophila TaxID=3064161 RepID=UPI00399C9101